MLHFYLNLMKDVVFYTLIENICIHFTFILVKIEFKISYVKKVLFVSSCLRKLYKAKNVLYLVLDN